MIRQVALLVALAMTSACAGDVTVRNGPQALSPSGGAALTAPVGAPAMVGDSVVIVDAPAATTGGNLVVVDAQPAPVTEINAGARFGAQAGILIANALLR